MKGNIPFPAVTRECIFSWDSFIHSGISISLTITIQRHSRPSTNAVSGFHAEAPRETASERLAQDTYLAARAGFEPKTLSKKGGKSTNELPRPTTHQIHLLFNIYLRFL